MMTPEQYFEQHPDVAVLAYGQDWHTEAVTYELNDGTHLKGVYPEIDWTGYDRRIAYNPHFAWGKRREVCWGVWQVGSGPVETNGHPYEQRDLTGGVYAYRFGRYVDAPSEKSANEPSRYEKGGEA